MYGTSNKSLGSGALACQVSQAGDTAVRGGRTVNCANDPLAQASANADMPASPIWFPPRLSFCKSHIWHIKQDCQTWRTRVPSLKAWEQGSGEPAHLQLRH